MPGYELVERALAEHREAVAVDTYSEEYRAACEARVVAAMESHDERRAYLERVAYHRGMVAMLALRNAAWALMVEPEGMASGEAPRG